MEDLVGTKREQILRLARRHGVTAVRVFGSMARGDAGPTSDVDLLVAVGPRRAAQRPCASRGRASVKDDRVYLIRNLQTWACEPAAERRNQGPPRRPKPPRLGQVLEAVVLLMMRAALVTGAQMSRDPTRKQPAAFLSPLPANEPPEARRRVVPVEAPIGDLEGQRLPLAAVGGRFLAIQS